MSESRTAAADSPAKHPFHLVEPSRWPMVGAIGAFASAYGLVMFMREDGPWVLLGGGAILLFTLFGWWRDVVREAVTGKAHSNAVRTGLRVGMGLFIASEVMFFVAFFWAYFHNALRINPGIEQWPPAGIETLGAWGVPLVNTLILLSSGGVLMWAKHALEGGMRSRAVFGIGLSAALGVLFLALQLYEYGHAAFAFVDGIYPSTFYMATGFHGFHVLVGVLFLTVCLFRTAAGHFDSGPKVGFQAAEWYWHFVDVVWVFLFTWFYWWGGI